MMTIQEKKGRIADLKVAIVGDIMHSRVARSNIYGLSKMGARVVVAGPATMMPRDIEQMGIRAYTKIEDAIADADVIMMLRIQLERQKQNIFPSLREYAQHYCLNRRHMKLAKPDAVVMHPGHEPGRGNLTRYCRRPRLLRHSRPGPERRRRSHGDALPAFRRKRMKLLLKGARVIDPGQKKTPEWMF